MSKIFALFNNDGFLQGFYNEEIHGEKYVDDKPNPDCKIPDNAVEVTEEQWQYMLLNQGGCRWENGQVVDYIPPLPPVDLIAYAADKRWQKETGGFEFNGLHIATDDRSKIMIAGAREAAKGNPDFTTPWVTSTGEIALLDAAAIIAISDAVGAHVNNVFGIYSRVLPQIQDGTITDQTQIDVAFA